MKLYFSLFLISMISAEEKQIEIVTPSGNVVTKQSFEEQVPQKIRIIKGKELEYLENLSNKAVNIHKSYVTEQSKITLESLDLSFKRWLEDKEQSFSSQEMVEILGGALGKVCVDNYNMVWVEVSDKYGVDYAVRCNETKVISYPFSSVLKRIKNKESNFMYGIFYSVGHAIQQAKQRKE